eukprot:g494.t1
MSKTQPEPRPFVEDMQDGTYNIQFVCATPGSYEINALVDGNKLPMCPIIVHISQWPPSATTTQAFEMGHSDYLITAATTQRSEAKVYNAAHWAVLQNSPFKLWMNLGTFVEKEEHVSGFERVLMCGYMRSVTTRMVPTPLHTLCQTGLKAS